MLWSVADISATKRGFALVPQRGREVVVLARPIEEKHADVLVWYPLNSYTHYSSRLCRRRGSVQPG
jgi:hypothetical protein